MAIAYDGINYFPVGVNFMEENAMEVIEAKYGIKGSAIVLKLLCKIYKEGYFIRWDEEQCLIFANKAGREVQAAEVQGIIEILFIKGILDRNSYLANGILTSANIQKIWMEATKRRKRDLKALPYLLVNDLTQQETEAPEGENVTINTKPNDGYEVDTVTVTDSKGNVIEVTKTADNEFSFVMPGSKVSVDVTFKEINDSPQKTPTPSGKDDWWFDDVAENEWYYAPIKSAYDNGLMSGVSDTEFAPDTDITRGMFITVLYRIDGETKSDVDYTFTDVNENDYFSNAVAWGSENNIISGYSDTEFAPNDNITREQMVSILKSTVAPMAMPAVKIAKIITVYKTPIFSFRYLFLRAE